MGEGLGLADGVGEALKAGEGLGAGRCGSVGQSIPHTPLLNSLGNLTPDKPALRNLPRRPCGGIPT